MFQKYLRNAGAVFLAIAASLALALPARAATNTVTGDIGGIDADLGDSNTVTLTTQTLALIKRAFLADGTPLTSGATLPRGTVVKFMIYVNNNTAFGVNDLSVQDVLAAGFTYQTGTIRVDNLVGNCAALACTPAEEAAIYTSVNATAAKTDAIDAPDVVSYNAGTTTIDAGNQSVAGNGQVDAAASKVWAMLFTVVMQ